MKKGTKSNPYHVLIADNWGAQAHPVMAAKYPNVRFSVYQPAPATHPHGHMVADCFCSMIDPDVYVDLDFYPYLELQRESQDGWLNVIAAEAKAGRPYDVCNCSFGAHHNNDPFWQQYFKSLWQDGTRLARARDLIGDTRVVFAAGNQDRSRRGRPHMDNDVNYPQRPLSALSNVFVIGACAINNVPSLFSSDGYEVFAMYWGEGVGIFDPLRERVVRVNGTSFASPFAAGDLLMLYTELGRKPEKDDYLMHVLRRGRVADGWARGDRHRKAGFGSMLHMQKIRMANLFPAPSEITALESMPAAYFDFDPVPEKRRFRSIFGLGGKK